MDPTISSESRIALVCLGGPENGPFTAMAARILYEVLSANNLRISAIYTCSGSTPTALLGCAGDFVKLFKLEKYVRFGLLDFIDNQDQIKNVFRLA